MEVITSTQNPAVKRMKALASRKGRLEQGCFLLEGPKLVGEALAAGFALTAVLVQESEWEAFEGLAERAGESGAVVSRVSRAAMESASDARTPQGILAAARLPAAPPPDQYAAGLWAVLDGVQDPGNMGTILRSADAMGAKGILLGPGCADPWPSARPWAPPSMFWWRRRRICLVSSEKCGLRVLRLLPDICGGTVSFPSAFRSGWRCSSAARDRD